MSPQILGISGSPIKNSNTDRLVQAVLAASGLKSEFVKLSRINVRPCIACLGCKEDNICKVKDDFPELAGKVRRANARWWVATALTAPWTASLRPSWSVSFPSVTSTASIVANWPWWSPRASAGVRRGGGGQRPDRPCLKMEGMEILGQLQAVGNPECLVCGFGESCPMSALPWVFGEDTVVTPEKFCRVEDQEVWGQAQEVGREIARRLKAQLAM